MGNSIRPWFFLPVLVIFFISFKAHLSIAADSISPAESLTGENTITSQGEHFVLGFFSPGNSSNYYIGIWYKEVSELTPVWVANRETPLPDKSSVLKISQDGNLVLSNQSQTQIWSTNITSITSNSTVAVLRDDGNLVLSDGSNSSAIIWQSFDHPTHTWLPGGKLGLNKKTKENQHLTSWKSLEDPAAGLFNLEIDPNGTSQYLIKWNRSVSYWTSGTWNGQIFSLVPEMTANYIYDFRYISNDNENYFTYSVKDNSSISRFVMDVSGQIKQLTWLENTKQWNLFWSQPREQCEVHSLCGAFGLCDQGNATFCNCLQGFEPKSEKEWNLSDWSSGCVRNTPLECGNNSAVNGEPDRFWPMASMQLPLNLQSLTSGRSDEECKQACLANCSCTAYASNSSGCFIWSGNLMNLRQLSAGDGNGQVLSVRLAASEFPPTGGKKGMSIGVIVGAVAGFLAVLCIVVLLIWRCQRRRLVGKSKAVEGSLVPFGYRELQSATKNFSEKLGGGGFGSVFKGTLSDSTAIAVKKLEGVTQGEKQFRMEVSTIGTVQHINLVRLLGFCSEGTKRLLVYDYMPNGSLDSHLFQKNSKILDWKMRYQIALGIARGLAYLHEKCRDCIIHCDIKPENILLDSSFYPKVADFGLAKLLGRDFSRVLTTMRGTRGYLAPEWISGIAITPKADVYSYGMMLFEIISGRRNAEQSEDGTVGFFPTWAANKIIEGEVLVLLDSSLNGDTNMDELTRACRVACWCVQDDENFRPTMGLVVQILEGILEVNVPPVPRSLQNLVGSLSINLSSESSDRSSMAQSNTSTSSQAKSTPSQISNEELCEESPAAPLNKSE